MIVDLMEGPMGKGGESFWTAIISDMADGVNLFPVETSIPPGTIGPDSH